ncbi:MAG: ATP-binding protein [Candidatus Paceibacterota bacterium]
MSNIKLAISGGKGGVGKSMLASSLSILFNEDNDVTAVDCDVDAPNLAIWLNEIENWDRVEEVSVSERPVIDSDVSKVKSCIEQCRFNALEVKERELKVNPFLCEGCGACEYFCPAVEGMEEVKSGWIKNKITDHNFPLITGQLKVGETGSGKIVTEVKRRADDFDSELQLIDSAPGTGCPVNAALQDVDFVVLIGEPTKSGFADLKRVKKVIDHFEVEFGVVVNKWEINKGIYKEIKTWADNNYLGKISYDQGVVKSVSTLTPIMKSDLDIKRQIKEVYKKIRNQINI